MDAPRNRRVPRFPRVSVAHANSSSLVRAHSFLTGGTATEQGWHRCRRRRDRVGIASREAPYSLSIIVDLGRELLGLLGPVHSYETSLPSLTTSLIINCISARLNCNGTFQCRSINESANPRSRSSDESGRGRAARGVSSWLWFRGLCFSVAAWCKEAPDGGSFSCFSRESPPRARRDRRPDLCDGFCRSAGLRPPEFHFGHFVSRAWRLLGGHQKKSEVFASLRKRVRSFFNSAFWNKILHPPDGP